MRVRLVLVTVGYAVLGPVAVASAQATQILPPADVVPLHSVIDVRTLPAPAAEDRTEGLGVRVSPFLAPDAEGLRNWKELLRREPVGPLGPPGLGDRGSRLEPEPRAPIVSRQFDGLSNADNVALTGFSAVPPDHILGAGPAHVFEMVNISGRILTKSGSAVTSFSLASFFAIDPGARETDPFLLFDAASSRWFAVYLMFSTFPAPAGTSSLVLAVSTSSDPTGAFCRYRLGNPTTEAFLQDFPKVGVSDDKVVVSYNGFGFPGQFVGAGYYVLNKADLTACAAVRRTRVAPDPFRVAPFPVQSDSSTSTLFMPLHLPATSTVTVLAVTGIPGVSPVAETPTNLAIRSWTPPPDAVQPGSSTLLQTNDDRVVTASWRSNSLWLGGNEACVPAGDSVTRSCVRLIEIRTDSMSVRQDITHSAAGQYFMFPAAREDTAGNLHGVFTRSSATAFAGVLITGRLAGDPLNTLQAPVEIRPGGGAQTHASGRMGDYAGAALDPTDGSKVWVVGQYVQSSGVANWGTWIAELGQSTPPVFTGGVYVATGRIDDIAGAEIVTGAGAGGGPHVRIFDANGAPLGPGFFAYAATFTGGVRVAACDFTGDGRDEIVTAAGPGGGPHVRVIQVDAAGQVVGELASFFAYNPAFTGGVFVACGDVDGDGTPEIITGADAGGGPHVRVFDGNGTDTGIGFFAYAPGFTGGVRVAAANLDGSDRASVITAAGPGGGPHVRAIKLLTSGGSLVGTEDLASFFAYVPSFTGGVFVAAGNVTGGGSAEIVTGADAGGGPHVRVFTGTGADTGLGFFAYNPGFTGGVRVATGNLNGAGAEEIVTAAGPTGGPHVMGFTGAGALTGTSFFAY